MDGFPGFLRGPFQPFAETLEHFGGQVLSIERLLSVAGTPVALEPCGDGSDGGGGTRRALTSKCTVVTMYAGDPGSQAWIQQRKIRHGIDLATQDTQAISNDASQG